MRGFNKRLRAVEEKVESNPFEYYSGSEHPEWIPNGMATGPAYPEGVSGSVGYYTQNNRLWFVGSAQVLYSVEDSGAKMIELLEEGGAVLPLPAGVEIHPSVFFETHRYAFPARAGQDNNDYSAMVDGYWYKAAEGEPEEWSGLWLKANPQYVLRSISPVTGEPIEWPPVPPVAPETRPMIPGCTIRMEGMSLPLIGADLNWSNS